MCANSAIEIRRLSAEWKQALLVFLRAIEEVNDTDLFRPHPFNEEAVERILSNTRSDLYYVLVDGTEVVGYGMLRGWDEGYAIPSLGIAVHPRVRSNGLGRALMHFLGAAAKCRGAERVRLRVKSQNDRARRLYESLGYKFRSEDDGGYLVGFLDLRSSRPAIESTSPYKRENCG
jgi:ribosomal protein S18 acetylase RimI-like enzyme